MRALTEPAEISHRLTAQGILESLEAPQIQELEKIGVYMEYQRELVTADGDMPGYFFYILNGDFEVSKMDPETGKKITLAHIGPGECFGEMSFLTGAVASANVAATDRVLCWAVPHDALRQFLETKPCGARLALQIAGLLARRVQEGNTRLLGLSSTLSAYFGTRARQSTAKSIEGPRSSDHAEMELTDDLFAEFARQTLGLAPDAPLSTEQKQDVQQRIENSEIDIVPWLEQGQRGKPLKVRLKFVSEHKAPAIAVSTHTAHPAAPATIVRVPQTRARIAPQAAYTPPPANPALRWLHRAFTATLLIILAAGATNLLPLATRESLMQSGFFQMLPFQDALHFLFFRAQTQQGNLILTKGDSFAMQFSAPKPVRLLVKANLPAPAGKSTRIQVVVTTPGKEELARENIVELTAGTSSAEILATNLSAGTYEIRATCVDGGDDSVAAISVTCLR